MRCKLAVCLWWCFQLINRAYNLKGRSFSVSKREADQHAAWNSLTQNHCVTNGNVWRGFYFVHCAFFWQTSSWLVPQWFANHILTKTLKDFSPDCYFCLIRSRVAAAVDHIHSDLSCMHACIQSITANTDISSTATNRNMGGLWQKSSIWNHGNSAVYVWSSSHDGAEDLTSCFCDGCPTIGWTLQVCGHVNCAQFLWSRK